MVTSDSRCVCVCVQEGEGGHARSFWGPRRTCFSKDVFGRVCGCSGVRVLCLPSTAVCVVGSMGSYFSTLVRETVQTIRRYPRLSTLTFLLVMLSRARSRTPVSSRLTTSMVAYSAFLKALAGGDVLKILFPDGGNGLYTFWLKGKPEQARTTIPPAFVPASLLSSLQKSGIPFEVAPPAPKSSIMPIVVGSLPFVYLAAMIAVIYKMYNDAVGDVGEKSNLSVGEAGNIPRVTFDQIAGIDDARARVMEVVDFIQHPERYERLGAHLSKGILLVGPPGTGKTMLARCIASEANVPFFYCSGSDFVEVFAGRGASRIRSLWKRAQANRPSLLFIDELDAIGGARGQGFSGNEEREQTLNQLLACMDGFDTTNSGVVVIGATNRYEMLDKALCRPGRFDRVIQVPLPSKDGRREILKVHLRDKNHERSLNVERLARMTDTFSGAELAHIVNESAISATVSKHACITQAHLELAIEQYSSSRTPVAGGVAENGAASFNLHDFLRNLSRDVN